MEHPEGSPEWGGVIDQLKANEIKKEAEVKFSNGESIWTTKALLYYKQTFIELAKTVKFLIINSTEGGILTEITRMPLKQSLETCCIKIIEKSDTFVLKKKKRKKKK